MCQVPVRTVRKSPSPDVLTIQVRLTSLPPVEKVVSLPGTLNSEIHDFVLCRTHLTPPNQSEFPLI